MNCGRVSNQLSAYLDRELTGIEMLHIRAHLQRCEQCHAEHEALSRMKTMLGRLRSVEPPRELVAVTLQRFDSSGMLISGARAAGTARRMTGSRTPDPFPGDVSPPSSLNRYLTELKEALRQLLGLIPWQPVSLALTVAGLALVLIFTSVVHHRQADATVAYTPPRVRLGMDPMDADWPPGDVSFRFVTRDPLLEGNSSLHWVNVSLEHESGWPSH